MLKLSSNRAVAIFLVLSMVMVVIIFANLILIIFSSQSRLSQHQISRTQAFYAGMAGINYALEKLRSGEWSVASTYSICASGCSVQERDFPHTIKRVVISIGSFGSGPNNTAKVKAKVYYLSP
ncbi:MAG: hypothetical protein NC900_06010 [Candidatus Omnitrophica bacterium]|nr:hypothetical protein [Candidatus Omnitrophota bacterium]